MFPSHTRSSMVGSVEVEKTIALLVQDLSPLRRRAVGRRLLAGAGVGLVVAHLLVALVLGYRADLLAASGGAMFWIKLAYGTSIGLLALWAGERLARPGTRIRARAVWLVGPFAGIAALALWRLGQAPESGWPTLLMGSSASVCSWLIVCMAAPCLAGLLWGLRGLAPTRLVLTGAMAGLAAGGLGAGAYALHCGETSGPFVAIWYSLGVAAASALGAAVGPIVLRW